MPLARLVALGLALLWCGVVQAATARAIGSSVYVNEMVVVTLRTPYRGSKPKVRAAILAKRLSGLRGNAQITIKRGRDGHQIRAASALLLVVSPAEAAAQKSPQASLARQWAAQISEALALPALRLSESDLRLPGGGKNAVQLVGTRALAAVVQSSDPAVVKVERQPGVLVLRAGVLGSATITAVAGDVVGAIRVEVLPYAANLGQRLFASVTGAPATLETVSGAIEAAVRTRLAATPGAEIKLLSVAGRTLRSGEAGTFAAKVHVQGPYAYPRQGQVQITVRNVGVAMRSEAELWYCNHPENVRGPGALFSATLRQEVPVRLLYHHMNISAGGMFVEVQLVNDTDSTARVLVIPGDSGPDKNPVQAGIVAAEALMRNWLPYSGEIVELPPRSAAPLSLRRFGPQETVSGLCSIRLLDGGPDAIQVRTDARVPAYGDPRLPDALASATPWHAMGPRALTSMERTPAPATFHVYPNPFKTEEVVYRVGGKFGFARIGQRPLPSADQRHSLDGNFGVFYTIHARLENPTDTASDIEVVFEASAGYSGALFVVNGEIRRTPLLQSKVEFRVVRVRLAAGESRDVTLLTVPLSGSSYPATLTVRPTDRAVRTWPDGAFAVNRS